MLLSKIAVEFGPHVGDWILIGVTACSVVASVIVAVMAYKNGATANEIAANAADREEGRRKADDKLRAREARGAVALAMLRALSAVQLCRAHPLPRFVDGRSIVEARKMEAVFDALARIDSYTSGGAERGLRNWFEETLLRVDRPYHFKEESQKCEPREDFNRRLESARDAVSKWERREYRIEELPEPR